MDIGSISFGNAEPPVGHRDRFDAVLETVPSCPLSPAELIMSNDSHNAYVLPIVNVQTSFLPLALHTSELRSFILVFRHFSIGGKFQGCLFVEGKTEGEIGVGWSLRIRLPPSSPSSRIR